MLCLNDHDERTCCPRRDQVMLYRYDLGELSDLIGRLENQLEEYHRWKQQVDSIRLNAADGAVPFLKEPLSTTELIHGCATAKETESQKISSDDDDKKKKSSNSLIEMLKPDPSVTDKMEDESGFVFAVVFVAVQLYHSCNPGSCPKPHSTTDFTVSQIVHRLFSYA